MLLGKVLLILNWEVWDVVDSRVGHEGPAAGSGHSLSTAGGAQKVMAFRPGGGGFKFSAAA